MGSAAAQGSLAAPLLERSVARARRRGLLTIQMNFSSDNHSRRGHWCRAPSLRAIGACVRMIEGTRDARAGPKKLGKSGKNPPQLD